MSCYPNSTVNSDGTCTCNTGYMAQGNGCVPFDINNPTASNNAQWKDYANQYGPVVLGGIAAWWAAQQAAKNQPAPVQNAPANTDGTPAPKQGIPMWAWIAGGVVVVVVAVALLRRGGAPVK